MKRLSKTQKKARRHLRIRTRVIGTAERPRLHVHRSLGGMYVQLIDDTLGKTLAAVHSKTSKPTSDVGERQAKVAMAYALGVAVAEKAKALKIDAVVFDRSGYAYHGRVQAVADGARAGGLQF